MKTIQLKNNQLHPASVLSDEIMLRDNTVTLTPKRDSDITLYIANQAPNFAEQTIIVNFTQPGARVSIFGLYQMDADQNLKINTVMNHAVAHCESRQVWKGILTDQAKADFEGKIIVACV